MEAKLLTGVLQSDTHIRQQAAEELLEWVKCEENDPAAFPELDRLVGGLVGWMTSSNFKVRGEGERRRRDGRGQETVMSVII